MSWENKNRKGKKIMSDDPIMDVTGGDDQTIKDVVEAFALPESPASVNIKVWIDGYGVMLTMRSHKVADVVSQLEYIIDTAKRKGWQHTWNKDMPVTPPPTPQPLQPTPAQPQYVPVPQPQYTQQPAPQPQYQAVAQAPQPQSPTPPPNCSVHGRPMKMFNGKYGAFFKCTAKLGENQWCDQKVNIK